MGTRILVNASCHDTLRRHPQGTLVTGAIDAIAELGTAVAGESAGVGGYPPQGQ
jgi:hypothetical protein